LTGRKQGAYHKRAADHQRPKRVTNAWIKTDAAQTFVEYGMGSLLVILYTQSIVCGTECREHTVDIDQSIDDHRQQSDKDEEHLDS
jgi:hypothetical protein